jgi:excisionase family DNA binding protein
LTIPEVAERLRVSRATVYRLVAERRIPAVRISSGAIRVVSGLPSRGKQQRSRLVGAHGQRRDEF